MSTSKRKILQITSYPPPRSGWGVRVSYLKQELESEGHTCVVLNLGEARRKPSPEYETVMNGWDYIRKVWQFSLQGFVVHMHGNGESPKGFVLMLLAETINLIWGKRCYLTFHAGTEQVYFPRPKTPALLPVYKILFSIPRRIICNSQAVKEKIAEYGIAPDKIIVIPAFSRQYLDYSQVELSQELRAFYRRFSNVIFTYIRIREGFYLEVLLDGFAKLAARRDDVGLAFCGAVGDVDPAMLADIEERISRHGLTSRLCIIDDLDHDQFLTALTCSSLYLRTPTTDGVAASVLESLALGVPVVASENGSRPVGVLTYCATDPEDMATVVEKVLSNRDTLSRSMPRPEIVDTLSTEVTLLTT